MLKNLQVYLLFFIVGQLPAQTAISGYVNIAPNEVVEAKVYLAKLDIESLENLKYERHIAWTEVKKDSSFSFDRKHLSDSDAVYRLYIKQLEKAINDTLITGTNFVLSKSDSIYFPKGEKVFTDYSSTNSADLEWKRLRDFEAELIKSKLAEEDEDQQLKKYTKDSLRILMVKLIGIQQLDEKDLLDQDITKHPDYYLSLLSELKVSEMPKAQYRFLERKLAFLTLEVVEQQYAWSRAINFFLGFLLLSLGALFVFRRKRQVVVPELSKQERTVRSLILQGKTNKEIANELFISSSTVKTHITNIYSKMKVSSRGELLRRFQN